LIPISTNSLVETNGFLWLPGIGLSSRFPKISNDAAVQALSKMDEFIGAAGWILNALVDPACHSYPKLANRWATALDWLAEAGREKSDAIALAKIGTCLDVLSCVGKFGGILDMLVQLLEIPEETVIFDGRKPKTLKSFVRETYDDGRSKILHGTHYERLISFSEQRSRADMVARIALIECAIRLQSYAGSDTDIAFRAIPKGTEIK
jgi:hypothetical protein